MQVIAERKQYHKDINNQNLTFGNSAESDEQIRGIYCRTYTMYEL